MSLLRGFLDRAKGQAASAAGKQVLAAYLAKYGDMLHFNVDPAQRTISLEMLPKGEKEPVQITLSGYEIVEKDGEPAALRVAGVSASREWIEVALREFVQGQLIALPPKAVPLLKLLL